MAERKKRISRRIWSRSSVILLVFFAVAAIVVLKLVKLQLFDYEMYKSLVMDEITIETQVNPERGTIYDANGNILATNTTVYLCFISPEDIIEAMAGENDKIEIPKGGYSLTTEKGTYSGLALDEYVAHFLADTLEEDYNKILEKAQKKGRRYEEIQDKISEEKAEAIRVFISENKLTSEIYLRAGTIRYYPYNDLAAHVIGFTNSDGIGTYGLEAYYNNMLEGTSGRYVTAQDALNNDMGFEYETYIEAENGYNLVTTIDTYMQYELENQLNTTVKENLAANRATGVVMNVKTGAVLAMATSPGFDLNAPYELDELSLAKLEAYKTSSDREADAKKIAANQIKNENPDLDTESEKFASLVSGRYAEKRDEFYETAYTNKRFELIYAMWKNKAITELYEPGSTSKIITTAMVFEEGVTNPNEMFTCTGAYMVSGYPYPIHCHERSGHGTVTYTRGLQQSCNPTLMQVALRLGREKFYKYFEDFGYTSRTGIDLPGETAGLYSSYKDFSNVSLAVYSFGQTYKTTPIQQITAIATVANGGYAITPHFLSRVEDDEGNVIDTYETDVKRQVISSDVCSTISAILENGVSTDGGARNAYVRGYKIAAKTGTSEKIDEKDEGGNANLRVSSTVAYAPYDDPEIAILIMVDEPMGGSVYGSIVAAPYVADFMANVLPYLGYEPQYTEEEMSAIEVNVLSYYGYLVENAEYDLRNRGLKCEVVGDGDTVVAQMPPAGSSITKADGTVVLYTGAETPKATVEVPDVIGKTAEAANRILVNAGLNVSLKGTGSSEETVTVVTQSIEAGKKVAPGTVVEISLMDLSITDD